MKSTGKNLTISYEISCQQILAEDHSVFSVQWVIIPAADAPEMSSNRLLLLYLEHIRRCTLGLVRPLAGPRGIDFHLGSTPLALIKFAPPRYIPSEHGDSTVLQIAGGALVQHKEYDRGKLEFQVERGDAGLKLALQLSDYCPLLLGSPAPSIWRKMLYRLTQAYIHKVVTIRFLAMVVRQIEGFRPRIKITKINLRSGEDT